MPDLTHSRILMIEDDEAECRCFTEEISHWKNMELVRCTDSAQEGLQIAEELSPDFIVLDLELNEGTGLQFLDMLYGLPVRNKPYIVVTTNNVDKVTLDMARCTGAGIVLQKTMSDYGPKKVLDHIERTARFLAKRNVRSKPLEEQPLGELYQEAVKTVKNETDNGVQIRSEQIRQEIRGILTAMGVTDGNPLSPILTEALLIVILCKHSGQKRIMLSNHVYPPLQETLGFTKEKVKHGLRDSIAVIWRKPEAEMVKKYYPRVLSDSRAEPTVKEFLFCFAVKYLDYHDWSSL